MTASRLKTGRGVAFFITACLAALLLAAGTILAVLTPTGEELIPAEGGSFQALETSENTGTVYYGDSTGKLYRPEEEEGFQVTEGLGISKILTTAGADEISVWMQTTGST